VVITGRPLKIREHDIVQGREGVITVEQRMIITMEALDRVCELGRSTVDSGVLVQPTNGLTNFPAFVAGEEW